MKKRICIVICVMLAAALTVTAVGCQTSITVEEMWNIAAGIGDNADLHITLKEGDTLIYEYQTENGAVTKDFCIEGIEAPDIADKLGGNGTLSFRGEYFSDGETSRDGDNTVYQANILQPANFLGIADATEGKIVIIANKDSKALVSTTISYTTARGNSVVVVATPY